MAAIAHSGHFLEGGHAATVAILAAGQSCRSAAKTFMVSVASGVKWSQRHRAVWQSGGAANGPAQALSCGAREGLGSGADRGEARLDGTSSAQGISDRAWWSATMLFGIFSNMKG
jgi:hypothetical protein